MAEIKIVECVPNFSEGQDKKKIEQIAEAIKGVVGINLLDVDSGFDTNRTVYTFVGEPELVLEAAFNAIQTSSKIIDMSAHKGKHPRLGAADVIPFIPVSNISMQECAELAHKLAQKVASELNIPIYMYEETATKPERKNLAEIRKGEYEGLAVKLQNPEWRPDYGEAKFNAKSGATIIGAREFLVAYNINLNSTDKNHATDIAFEIREKGRVARIGNILPFYSKGEMIFYKENAYPCGTCNYIAKNKEELAKHCFEAHAYNIEKVLADNDINFYDNIVDKKVYKPGKFNYCKALGWYVDDYKRAQITINLTNYKQTPVHVVYDEAHKIANNRGCMVTGSEIVGLIPFDALLQSGKYYLEKQKKSKGLPVKDILHIATISLGLNEVQKFDIEKKVLALPKYDNNALVSMKIYDFIDEVSRDTPAPGGGSIAALAGSLGSALVSMVANLAYGKTTNTDITNRQLSDLAEKAQKTKDNLLKAVDDDTNAFNVFMDAKRLANNTLEEKNYRIEQMQKGIKIAIQVPYCTALLSFEALQLAYEAVQMSNQSSITDAAVGAQISFSGLKGAIWNVLINLKDINDKNYVQEMIIKCENLENEAKRLLEDTLKYVEQKLHEMIVKKHGEL